MREKLINSPIREVVFEIVFKKDLKLDSTIPGLLFEEIQEKFPNKKNVVEGKIEFKFDSKEKEPIKNISQQEIPQFLTSNGSIFVIIKKDRISIHHLKKYTSWENYYDLMKFVYNKLIAVVKKSMSIDLNKDQILRLGLRYINNIEIPSEDFKVEDYFNYKLKLVDDENSLEAFILGGIYKKGDDFLKIQFNTGNPDSSSLNFVLDLDYFTNIISSNNIMDWLNKAHEQIEEIFFKSITNKTIKILKQC